MYKAGDLQIVTLPCADTDEYGDCFVDGHIHTGYDSRPSEECALPWTCLPHSCDEWIIGGPEQIKLLIADLCFVLKRMEGKESP